MRANVQYAERDLITNVLDQWWKYLANKARAHPYIANGIATELIDDYSLQEVDRRTIKFSLVEGIAPELRGLGKLVRARRPHVYVEGTRNSETVVLFDELYKNVLILPDMRIVPFTSDPENILSMELKKRNLEPERFLLHIDSANDYDADGYFRNIDNVDLLVFATKYDIHAYTIRGGWREVRIPLPNNSYRSFYFPKKPKIKQSTREELEIVYQSFLDACRALN